MKRLVLTCFAIALTCSSAVRAQSDVLPPAQSPASAPATAAPRNGTAPTLTPEERAAQIRARQEQLLRDWANLARYQTANANVTGEVTAVFMGDSITELWASKPEQFFPRKPYINRGIGGQTTPQMLLRFQQDVVDLKPKVVVINGGTNDIAGNTGPSTLKMIEDNLKSMVQIANSNSIRVVLSSVTPAYDYPWKRGLEPAEKVISLNVWIKQFCSAGNCIYADYFTPMSDEKHAMREGLSVDGIHPTTEGYQIMAGVAEKAIEEALGHR
jgi:lysophospholipase L1-like esterase